MPPLTKTPVNPIEVEVKGMFTAIDKDKRKLETILKKRNSKVENFLNEQVEQLVPSDYLNTHIPGYAAATDKKKFIAEKMDNADKREMLKEYVAMTGKDPIKDKLRALSIRRAEDRVDDEEDANAIVESCERLLEYNKKGIKKIEDEIKAIDAEIRRKNELIDEVRSRKKKTVTAKNGVIETEEDNEDRDKIIEKLEEQIDKMQTSIDLKKKTLTDMELKQSYLESAIRQRRRELREKMKESEDYLSKVMVGNTEENENMSGGDLGGVSSNQIAGVMTAKRFLSLSPDKQKKIVENGQFSEVWADVQKGRLSSKEKKALEEDVNSIVGEISAPLEIKNENGIVLLSIEQAHLKDIQKMTPDEIREIQQAFQCH